MRFLTDTAPWWAPLVLIGCLGVLQLPYPIEVRLLRWALIAAMLLIAVVLIGSILFKVLWNAFLSV
jgi:hypothetical protein